MPRNDSMVTTSQPDWRTTFARTSDRASVVAAAMPGATGTIRREADGEELMANGLRRRRGEDRREDALVVNERAGAELGEQFEQHGVRHFAVEDHYALDTAVERIDAGLDFRNHAAGNRPVGDQTPCVVDR